LVCGGCVKKLAFKLLKHHSNLDLIRAFELAEKGVERVEAKRKVNVSASSRWKRVIYEGFNPDYGQSCTVGGYCYCIYSVAQRRCLGTDNSCSCSCPDALPNSHYVSDTCARVATCSSPPGCGCDCSCSGGCSYDCDEGYEWNGEECVEITAGQPYISRVQRVAGMSTWGGH